MIKKIISHAWSLRREFIKYFIVGFSGFFIDILTLIALKELLGLNPVVAVLINQPIVLAYNFSLNKYWSFRNKAMPHRQIVRYLTLSSWNYIFSFGAMYVLNQQANFDYRLVRVASIVVMVSWNFILYKYWVYKDKEEPIVNPASEY